MSSNTSYRVFLGAPSRSDLLSETSDYRWQTFASDYSERPKQTQSIVLTQHRSYASIIFPQATLEAATRRISLVYKDFLLESSVFGTDALPEDELDLIESFVATQEKMRDTDTDDPILPSQLGGPTRIGSEHSGEQELVLDQGPLPVFEPLPERYLLRLPWIRDLTRFFFSDTTYAEQTTLYTWPPTAEPSLQSQIDEDEEQEVQESLDVNANRDYRTPSPNPLIPSEHIPLETERNMADASNAHPSDQPSRECERSVDLSILNVLREDIAAETQGTATDFEESYATEYTNASSVAIGRFPHFHFNLHAITALSQLSLPGQDVNPNAKNSRFYGPGGDNRANNPKPSTATTRKVNMLLAILEVDGPEKIKLKKGADAGTEISILKLVLGDEDGSVCRLTAWRRTAEDWGEERPLGHVGQLGECQPVKRGDIVHLQGVMATCEPGATVTLSASPHLGSKLTICYRVMPRTLEDNQLRPDLRLGESEPCVRKVARVVKWFETMAGLA